MRLLFVVGLGLIVILPLNGTHRRQVEQPARRVVEQWDAYWVVPLVPSVRPVPVYEPASRNNFQGLVSQQPNLSMFHPANQRVVQSPYHSAWGRRHAVR